MLTFRSQLELSAEPDTHKSVLIFPAWCSQLSETKLNAKMALVRLAFLINAHQNANQKSIGSAPAYRAECTHPADLPDPPFRFFEGLVPRLPVVCVLY